MFTGLIEDVGIVRRIELLPSGTGRRLTLEASLLGEELPIGASLAVDGVCLTVTSWQTSGGRGRVTVEAGPETLECTTLGGYAEGTRVNLERPMALGERLGGHMVSGHVDGVGGIEALTERGEAIDVRVSVPASLMRYVVEKGSIAIDGVSLTVAAWNDPRLTVALIPYTLEHTIASSWETGTEVNLEVDIVARYLERLLAARWGEAAATGSGSEAS